MSTCITIRDDIWPSYRTCVRYKTSAFAAELARRHVDWALAHCTESDGSLDQT